MARSNEKESTLTLEEKLAQALVPDWEQPYKVPKNWCWTYLLKGAAECMDSFRKPINATERAVREGEIPYYGATGQVGWIDDYLTDEELVLLGEDGAPFLDPIKDKAYLITGKAWVNNHAHILRSYYGSVGNQYLMNYLNTFNYTGYVNGATRLKLTQASMSIMPVPIPPISEQQRIVDRLAYLFAKIDGAKAKAQSVMDSFEARKTAILHKAFTGELTAQWRVAHFLSVDTWKNSYLKDICNYMKAGGDKPADFVEEQDDTHCIPVVANGISNDGIIGYSSEAKYDGETVTISGRGTIGYSIYRNYPYYPVVRLIVLGPKKDIHAKFLKYAFDAFPEEGTGSSIPQLTVPMIKGKVIPVPLIEEQTEIVRILDSLFTKEQQAKEAAEAVLEKIDLLKKSILVRAFRGELGANDPAEESALELLKQVLQEDVPVAPKKRSKSIPKELQEKLGTELERKIVKLYFKQETDSLPAEELLSVSSKKFDVMETLHNLEGRGILKKLPNENYRLLE